MTAGIAVSAKFDCWVDAKPPIAGSVATDTAIRTANIVRLTVMTANGLWQLCECSTHGQGTFASRPGASSSLAGKMARLRVWRAINERSDIAPWVVRINFICTSTSLFLGHLDRCTIAGSRNPVGHSCRTRRPAHTILAAPQCRALWRHSRSSWPSPTSS
jgi:hypothetical protein